MVSAGPGRRRGERGDGSEVDWAWQAFFESPGVESACKWLGYRLSDTD